MNYKNYIHLLKNNPLFNGIDEAELDDIMQCLLPIDKRYSKNEIVANAGDAFEGIGLLLEGSLLVVRENAAGERCILSLINPGEFFGEMAAFTESPVWPASVEANSDCYVVFVKPQAITGSCSKACRKHQQLIANMLRIVSDKALSLNRKVTFLSTKSMRSKICSYILEQHIEKGGSMMLQMPLNRNQLAEYLGVSRPSMSRELSRMKNEGIIDFHLASVKILDLRKLKSNSDR